MIQRKIRCTVVAAALAAVLALAAPAQAASHPRTTTTLRSGWLETVWQWVAGVWGGGGQPEKGAGINNTKTGYGIDPNGSTVTTQPTNPSADTGYGIDPNGG
jgi:hypothetical protein